MKKYSESKSLLIHFPDHSLDIYDTSDDYFGHARPGDTQSLNHCLDIPFMIYISPCLKEFPSIKEKVLKIKDNEINTENLMDVVLSISGWDVQ